MSIICASFDAKSAEGKTVYFIPIENTIEKGLVHFIKRSIQEAEKEKADVIVFELNTPGGALEAAIEIGKMIMDTDIKTIAYVNKHAISAGAYIALRADQIYYHPGGTIGSAAVIDSNGNAAEVKVQSFWKAEMRNAAEVHGRDPMFAEAMVDSSLDMPEYGAEKGELLTLTAKQAMEVGYGEGIAKSRAELLKSIGMEGAKIQETEETFAEKIARFVTNMYTIPILLTISGLGFVLELYTPGFGIPGFIGLLALFLFFFGHFIAGLAGLETVVLFVLGVLLIIAELFVPGGIIGAIGFLSVLLSLFLAADHIGHMAVSLFIAGSISIFTIFILSKVIGKRMKWFKKIILNDSISTEKGYVSNQNRTDLIGKTGVTVTALRPAGTVMTDGEERLDVVTEGTYIEKGKKVKIVKVEGSRIVVRAINENE